MPLGGAPRPPAPVPATGLVPVRSPGGPRRSRLIRALLVVLGGALVAGAVGSVTAAPAAASGPGQQAPAEGCAHLTDRAQWEHYNRIFVSNGFPYWECPAGVEGDNCLDLSYEVVSTDVSQTVEVGVCGVEGESVIVRCRDEETGVVFGADDVHGGVLVPADYRERGWGWWVSEIRYESQDITYRREGREVDGELGDNVNLGARGCELGANPPVQFCFEMRRRRIALVAELADLRQSLAGRPYDPVSEEATWREIRQREDELEGLGGRANIVPDECWGTLPTRHYNVEWSASDFSLERLMGWLATMTFAFGRMAVSTALWLLGFAFLFDVTEYLGTVVNLAETLDLELIHFGERGPFNDFSLFDIAWFSLFAYAGYQMLRGRIGKGGAEIATSIALAALASVFVGYTAISQGSQERFSVGTYAHSFAELIDRSSAAMLMVTNDAWDINDDLYCRRNFDEAAGEDWGEPVDGQGADGRGEECSKSNREANIRHLVYENQSRIHEEFIERPYMYVNYNQDLVELDPPDGTRATYQTRAHSHPCHAAINNTLATAYHGSGWEQRYLDRVSSGRYPDPTEESPYIDADGQRHPDPGNRDRHDCGSMSQHIESMNVDRLMNTVFVMLVSVTVAVLLGLTASTLLVVKFLAGVAFAMLPLAALAAVFPGRARETAWLWLGIIVQLWLAAMGAGLVVAVLLFILDAIHETTQGRPLAERWVIVVLGVGVVYVLRTKVITGSQRVANSLASRLSNSQPRDGGGVSWAGDGARGLDLAKLSGSRSATAVAQQGAVMGTQTLVNWALVGASGALVLGGRAALGTARRPGRSVVKRTDENRVQKKALRNLETMDKLRRGRDLRQQQTGERSRLSRAQQGRRAQLQDRLDRQERRLAEGRRKDRAWLRARDEERERRLGLVPLRQQRDTERRRLLAAERRQQQVRYSYGTVARSLAQNRAIVADSPAGRAARALGLTKGDLAGWNANPGDKALARQLKTRAAANRDRSLVREGDRRQAARSRLARSEDRLRRLEAVHRRQGEPDRDRLRKREQARQAGVARQRDREAATAAQESARLAARQRDQRADMRTFLDDTTREPRGTSSTSQRRIDRYEEQRADEP